MFRFKLRTLLIATTLVGVFLGLQVHVHIKAKQFVEEMKSQSVEAQKRLIRDAGLSPIGKVRRSAVSFEPVTFIDVVVIRRRAKVDFYASVKWKNTFHAHRYLFSAFGDRSDFDSNDCEFLD